MLFLSSSLLLILLLQLSLQTKLYSALTETYNTLINSPKKVTPTFVQTLKSTITLLERNINDVTVEKLHLFHDKHSSLVYNEERVFKNDDKYLPFKIINILDLSLMTDDLFNKFNKLNKMRFNINGDWRGLGYILENVKDDMDQIVGCCFKFE